MAFYKGQVTDAAGQQITSVRLVNDGDANSGVGTLLDPIRIDPTGTTVQPVSFASPQHVIVDSGGGGGGGAVTVADGADVAQGTTTDAAVTSDVSGTVSAKLRGIVKIFADVWDSVNHRFNVAVANFPATQAVSLSSSVAVTGTFWQSTQPVSAASLPLPSGAAQDGTDATGVTAPTGAVGIRGWLSGIYNILKNSTVAVTGTFWQSTQPVSIAAAVTVAQATAANLLCKADIVGNGGATLDATVGAAAAPTNGIATLAQYNSSAPAPTAAQTQAVQSDAYGNVFVNHIRRSQVKPVTGSIASITAATMLAAQASGIFADLSTLVLTLSGDTAAAYITVNISDGTNTYKFGYAADAIGVASAGGWPLTVNFDPPLPATNAATAWTIALSVADATIFYVATFILQKAS